MLTSLLSNQMHWVELKASGFFPPLNSGLDYFISKFKNEDEMRPLKEIPSSLPPNHSVLGTLIYFLPLKCP